MGGVSLPVLQLHPQRVLTLTGQQEQSFITQPVFSQHVPEALQEERRFHSSFVFYHLFLFIALKRQTDHSVFPPAPLEVHAAVKSPLEDGPASTSCLHVTVHLQRGEKTVLTLKTVGLKQQLCESFHEMTEAAGETRCCWRTTAALVLVVPAQVQICCRCRCDTDR